MCSVAAQAVDSADEIDFNSLNEPQLDIFKTASLKRSWAALVSRARNKGMLEEYHCKPLYTRMFTFGADRC